MLLLTRMDFQITFHNAATEGKEGALTVKWHHARYLPE
jgi:hypothetical protein